MRSMGATPVLLAAIVALAATARPSPATEFGITALLGTGSQAIEHNGVTGDDRGGIAVSSTHVFYSGDSATGRFNLADLSGGASIGTIRDSLASDLRIRTSSVPWMRSDGFTFWGWGIPR